MLARTLLVFLLFGTGVAHAEPSLRTGWTVQDEARLPKAARKLLKSSVRSMKKGDYAEVIERLLHPEERAKMPPIDAMVKAFEDGKAAPLQDAMAAALDGAKVWNVTTVDGVACIAIEVRESVPSVPRDLVLQQSDGLWYLRN